MINKTQIKLIKSLSLRKNRLKHKLFLVEGDKNVLELINSDFDVHTIFANTNWSKLNPTVNVTLVSNKELSKISNQKNPNNVLAIAVIKESKISNERGVVLVLDDISDPGNFGTIIRTCDWFGVTSIICSNNTVDVYNPKVVQCTMGSIFRVKIIYTDLAKYLKNVKSVIYGTLFDGNNIKEVDFKDDVHIVMGNESNGISKEISNLISEKIKINSKCSKADSLNVAVATSILLYEITNS
jgi:TrmH family RNA methyltransferase